MADFIQAFGYCVLNSERFKEIVFKEAKFNMYENEELKDKLVELAKSDNKQLSYKVELFFHF